MLRGKIFLMLIFCLFISSVGYSATELDGDTNGGVDITKGGTNATTASGARTALGLVINTDVLAPNGNGSALTNLSMSNIPLQEIGTATYDDLNEYLNATGTAGLINGGLVITDDGDGTITVSAGSGFIRSTDSPTGQFYSFDIAQSTPVLTNNALNYVYVDYNSGVPIVAVTTDETSLDNRTQFVVGLVRKDDTSIHIGNSGQRLSDFKYSLYHHAWEHDGLQRSSGMIISEVGVRGIAITAGTLWLAYNRTTTSAFDSSGADRFKYLYRDGGVGWTEVSDQSQISNTQYDDGDGGLGTLTAAHYGVAWVFQMIDGDVYVLYGQGDYLLAQAQAATVPSTLPSELSSELAVFIGKIIILANAATFTSVTNPFTGVIGLSAATDHGSLGGLPDDDHPQYGALAQDETVTGAWALGTPASGDLSNCTGVMHDVSDDTTPDLGGDLGVNGHEIQSSTNIVFRLGDNAGSYSWTLYDSDGSVIFQINSDGEMSIATIDEELLTGVFTDATADGIADDTYTGADVISGKTLGESCSQWVPVYLAADGKFYGADGSENSGRYPAIGVTTSAGGDGSPIVVLTRGFVRNDGWNWSNPGAKLLLDDTQQGIVETSADINSGECVQSLGTVMSDDEIYFNVSPDYGIAE